MPILRVKDPLVTELEKIVTTQLVEPVTFIHANLLEANFGLDQIGPDVSFPVCVHVATGKSKVSVNEGGDWDRVADVYLLLLQRYDAPTVDYASKDVSDIVWQMHQLALNLMYFINKSPISVAGGVDDVELTDVYQKFDSHLFGQAVKFTWEIDEATSGYINRAY